MPASATFLLRMRWQLAALRVEVAFLRVRLFLRAYHPDQPRVPAGNPHGGQWTDGDAGDGRPAGDDARIVPVGDRDDRRYRVDLEEEKDQGHTLRDHVGKTDDAMMQRVLRERSRSLLVSSGRKRDGSFSSREAANDFVNRTLQNNAATVDAVAEGKVLDSFVTYRFGYPTRREAYSTVDIEPYMRTTYGVGVFIVHDAQAARGYRVITACPRNDGD